MSDRLSIWDMEQAVNDARRVLDNADRVASQAARLVVGRLRKCDAQTVKRLKRELRDFNIHTGQWKEDA